MFAQSREFVQVLIFSVIIVFIPLFIFPSKLGLGLASGSYSYSIFEIAFYGVVFYLFRSQSTVLHVLAGAGLTFLYRILIGTLFGLLIAVTYGMDLSISLALGVSKYLPSIILHAVAAPFIMRPFFLAITNRQDDTPDVRLDKRQTSPETKRRDDTRRFITPVVPENSAPERKYKKTESSLGSTSLAVSFDTNGFERAVKYIGEHHAVMVASVVDYEGLTMATFERTAESSEKWAAHSLLFQKINEELLAKNNNEDRISNLDLTFGSSRLTIMKVGIFNLLVLSNNEEDELLRIRITQAAEIIRKYTSERYGRLLSRGTEEQYVSSTRRA
jgi:hypothetical protein